MSATNAGIALPPSGETALPAPGLEQVPVPGRWRRLTPRRIVVGALRSVLKLSTTVIILVVVGLVAASTALATYVFMPLPVNLPEERLQPERQASTVFALDGTPIGVFKGVETQVEVSPEDIPATIAFESPSRWKAAMRSRQWSSGTPLSRQLSRIACAFSSPGRPARRP